MYPLRSLLERFSRQHSIDDGLIIERIRSNWAETVGDTISLHTHPETIRHGVITVLVDSPQWLHHIGFYKSKIIEVLSEYGIKDVRLRLGRIPSRGTPPRGHRRLTPTDEAFIEDSIRVIKDEDLRERFRSLMRNALERGREKG